MLNRRYLRIKVFQQLYSFFINPEADINRYEMELFKSLEKIYDLYLSLIYLLVELNKIAEEHLEKSKARFLPTPQDWLPQTKFIHHSIFILFKNNVRLQKYVENKKLHWDKENDLPAKIFKEIRQSQEYTDFVNNEIKSFAEDKNFLLDIYKKFIFSSEELHYFFEEKNIHWEDDITLANLSVLKTIENIRENSLPDDIVLMPLYKDEREDTEFVKGLYRKTIQKSEDFKLLISEKAANWELERIAVADMILMKMALCELMEFENIPVKVTLNEYIEISKDYSTPQSKTFINGILDKLTIDLKSGGKILKKGRGLVE